MGFKTKTTAIAASMFLIANAVGVQANTAVTSNAVSTLCGSAFVGCVLPGKTAPKAVPPVQQAPVNPAPVVEEASKKGIFGTLAPILAAAAVVAGIVIALDGGDDEDAPVSP